MVFFIFSLVCSTVLLAIVAALLSFGYGAKGVFGVAVLATVAFACLFTPAVALQGLFTALVAAACLASGSSRRAVFLGALAAMAAGYAILFGFSGHRVRTIAELRRDYPLVSVADRLAYEVKRADEESPTRDAAQTLAAPVAARLHEFEERPQWSYRVLLLRELHELTVADFVAAAGFGFRRMPTLSRGSIELPDPGPIRLPSAGEAYSSEAPSGPLAATRPVAPVTTGELATMHQAGITDLFDTRRMGYVRDREHVAGFQPHGFSSLPSLGYPSCNGSPTSPWQLVRLELIGLMRHETPRVYVSQTLPRMDELGDAPTRPLNAFERESLEKLRCDEDVVTRQSERRIEMVGSLRAGNDCLACHSLRRGDLLGALSYELRPRGTPVPRDPDQQQPQARRRREGLIVQLR